METPETFPMYPPNTPYKLHYSNNHKVRIISLTFFFVQFNQQNLQWPDSVTSLHSSQVVLTAGSEIQSNSP